MSLTAKIKRHIGYIDLDVAFSCGKGNILVLIGPSGSGKTTIIRTIAGLERPDEGVISYEGETWVDTHNGIFQPSRRRHLGYVFQDYTLFPHLTIYRNVAFASRTPEHVETLMRLFGIYHLRHRKPAQVSGGERQRCAICQALARHPRVLLLDEPFSALDVITRGTLRDMIVDLKSELHIPIIYVTHDINEALSMADEVLPIVAGKVEKGWIDSPVAGSDDADNVVRLPAARERRLTLAY